MSCPLKNDKIDEEKDNLATNKSKENHQKAAAASNALWKDPVVRQHRTNGIKNSYTPKLRERKRELAIKQMSNPEQRKIRKEKLTGREVLQETRDKLSESRLKLTSWGRLRLQLNNRSGNKCEMCGISNEELIKSGKKGLCIHHQNYDKLEPLLEDLKLLCQSCHRKLHNDLMKNENARFNQVCRNVNLLLQSLGLDVNNPNYLETPRRVASWLIEFTQNKEMASMDFEDFANSVFPTSERDLIAVSDIKIFSLCPHHLLPVIYNVDIVYLPNEAVIGLSKLARFAKTVGSTPYLQEEYVSILADTLAKYLGTNSVMVIVTGRHMCMEMRGIRNSGKAITTAVRGDFLTDKSLKQEAYQMLEQTKRAERRA